MILGEWSFVVSAAGTVPYIREVIRGKVRPHRVTWFIWTMILVLTLLGYRAAGAGDSDWFIAGDLVVTAAAFLLSLWRGRGGYSRLDIACLSIALISMLAWQVFKLPIIVLLGTIIADSMGVAPTVASALKDPESESATPFAFSSLAAAMGFVAVGQWNWLLLFYPAYLFLANFITAVVVLTSQYQIKQISAQLSR